jgi:uncharacterized membrane protein YsdA (DUF1294 family)
MSSISFTKILSLAIIMLKMMLLDEKKAAEHKNKIGEGDLMKVLVWLGQKPSKSEVKLIIWVSTSRCHNSF